ncbi:MAG: acyltransferase [Candidatus Shapirobacteria bacterium]|nr:acyltransferase [Candidatus Shapirobacteria bacterium]
MVTTKLNRTEKYQYIDSLRGFAVFAVLLTHCQLYGSNQYSLPFKSLLDHGTLGVQLFFIISAFTLCLSFNQKLQFEKHPILNFYLRRFFRIMPLFLLATIFYHFSPDNLDNSIPFNSLVPGSWTIFVESGFYLIFPFLFFRINSLKRSLWFSLFLAIIYQIFYYIYYHQVNNLYYYLPAQLSVFLIGFILFHFTKIKLASLKPTLSDLALGQLFILIIIIQLSSQTILPYHFIFSILFGISIYLLSLYPIRLFVNKITAYIGKISFSLYITHFAVLKFMDSNHLVDFVNQNYLNFFIRLLLLLIVSTLVSTLTYYLIELPFINLGQKLINRYQTPA